MQFTVFFRSSKGFDHGITTEKDDFLSKQKNDCPISLVRKPLNYFMDVLCLISRQIPWTQQVSSSQLSLALPLFFDWLSSEDLVEKMNA
jgi:hypothetical protein